MMIRHSSKIGLLSSAAVAVIVLLFLVYLILGLFGISMNSASFFVQLWLALFYVVMVICIGDRTPPEKEVFLKVSLTLSLIYAVLCSLSCYVQLAVVRTNPLALSPDVLVALGFVPGSVFFSAGMLGYTFLALSTLFLIPFAWNTALKVLLAIHGAMALPAFVFPLLGIQSSAGGVDYLSYGFIFWCMLFLPIVILFMIGFIKQLKAEKQMQ
ncbi:MAG: hypothetical protein Q8O09_05340 [Bacillota bacterium]|nr:hypothetical protein [Bacillota bacterium]